MYTIHTHTHTAHLIIALTITLCIIAHLSYIIKNTNIYVDNRIRRQLNHLFI